MINRTKLGAVIIAALSGTAMAAGTATANFEATATLNASCTLSADNMNFGSISPSTSGFATATGNLTATCTKDIPYKIAMGVGISGADSVLTRAMIGGVGNTDKLSYNMYFLAIYVPRNIWGGGLSGTQMNVPEFVGTGSAQSIPIYGRMPLNQYVVPDNYSDTLMLTLEY